VQKKYAGASGNGHRHVSPIAQRSRRNVADQEIAKDATAKSRGACQHQQAQEIEISADGGIAPSMPKKNVPVRSTA
jgi:hypothetical protein